MVQSLGKRFMFEEPDGQWIFINLIACYLHRVHDEDYLAEYCQHYQYAIVPKILRLSSFLGSNPTNRLCMP